MNGLRGLDRVKLAARQEADTVCVLRRWLPRVARLPAVFVPGGRLFEEAAGMLGQSLGGVFVARATEGYIRRQEQIAADPPRWDYHLVSSFEEPPALSWYTTRRRSLPWLALRRSTWSRFFWVPWGTSRIARLTVAGRPVSSVEAMTSGSVYHRRPS
jgi:hypothetical protein